jgi:prepilin-type N-terminal cleavage/methylation domain-containing protein
MSRRYARQSTHSHRPGVTLIEVLAGLVILGTLLVSIAAARGRFARQWIEADRRLAAVRSADALLGQWMAGPPQNIPLRGQGELPGVPKFDWRTRTIPSRDADDLRAIVVRLEVFDRSSRQAREPLFHVDFLVHDFRQPVAPSGGTP